jgi:pimeloyl-ACP methyl ester carboxylesterase
VWYHYVDYLSDVIAALGVLGWRTCRLLGHSLGGTLASVLAASRPAMVEQLWLIEALGPVTGAADQALAQLRRALDQRDGFEAKSLRVFADAAEAVAARRAASGLSQDAAKALVTRGIKRVDGGFSWSSDPRLTLASPVRYTEEQILALLRGIEAPTLLLLARPEQPYLAHEMIQRRIDVVRDIEVSRHDGSHHLHLEDAQPIAAAIGAFAARTKG